MTQDYSSVPDDLPQPQDDGACAHLPGRRLPALALPATQGGSVDLSASPGRTAIFVYPMTGRPGVALPDGWDAIPGARGCTPQNCAIRDAHRAFADLGVAVTALSTQTTEYQAEMAARLHLPYPVLSDAELRFARALDLPLFEADGMPLIRRLTLVATNGVIERVFYPVFPPDRSTEPVLAWLQSAQLQLVSCPSSVADTGMTDGKKPNLKKFLAKSRRPKASDACQNFPLKG